MLTDSHCHLTDARFDGDRDETIARAVEAGVRRMVTISSNAADAVCTVQLAGAQAEVWATVGIHPHEVETALPADLDRIRELASDARVVAVGETGLDFHYDHAPRDVQLGWFERHFGLADEVGLPLVVHSRQADDDTQRLIEAAPGVVGVLHCFTGGRALLEAALSAGWYIGYGGIVTFRNFDGVDLLRGVPADRLLLETDAPYLAPVPRRGKRNEPSFVTYARDRIADLRDVSVEELERSTSENALRLFGFDG